MLVHFVERPEERLYWARVVREVQKLSGLTVDALALKLKVSPREVAYWKSGVRRPTGMVSIRLYEYRCHLYGDTSRTLVHSASRKDSLSS